MDTKPITKLEDVAVETLGLVSQGANREEFFLLKNAQDTHGTAGVAAFPPDVTTETATEQLAVTFWQKLIKALRDTLSTSAFEPTVAENALVAQEDIASVIKQPAPVLETSTVAGTDDVDDVADVADVANKATNTTIENTDLTEAATSGVIKTVIVDTLNVTTTSRGLSHMDDVTISKAEYDALAIRLAKTESDLAASREKEERQVWLLKATNLAYVPTATTELTDQLYWLYKADPKRAQYWEDTLTALNNMVQDSQMFVEKGTKQMPTEGLDAVLKSSDPRAAIKNLSRADAEAYLKAARNGGR